MKNMEREINTAGYWDDRFATNWDERRGMQQSVLFARVFVKLLPEWVKGLLVDGGLSICDWGCAEGEGVVELQKHFSKNSYYGIDFSKVAIETARKRYDGTGIKFVAADLLKQVPRQKYDMILSSNVFEHFHDPWSIFDVIGGYVKKYVAVLVPYKEEAGREKEHFHSFDQGDFRMVRGDYVLVHIDTLDTCSAGLGKNLAWVGEQVLAIYARRGEVERIGLSAKEITLTSRGRSAGEINGIQERRVRKLRTEYDERLLVAEQRITDVSRERGEVVAELEKVRSSRRYKAASAVADTVNKVLRRKS